MIGIYLIERREQKISIDQIKREPNFLPVNVISEEFMLNDVAPNGYYIMPCTYQSRIHGSFILSIGSDRDVVLQAMK